MSYKKKKKRTLQKAVLFYIYLKVKWKNRKEWALIENLSFPLNRGVSEKLSGQFIPVCISRFSSSANLRSRQ